MLHQLTICLVQFCHTVNCVIIDLPTAERRVSLVQGGRTEIGIWSVKSNIINIIINKARDKKIIFLRQCVRTYISSFLP